MNRLRFTDFIVLFLAAAITIVCAVYVYAKDGSVPQVVIEGKKGNWVYPINQTVQIDIPGPLGQTTVKIEDGKARVISSPCANQTCVTSGSIHTNGQWIACLPNAVFVRVESKSKKQAGQDAGQTELDGAVW